MVFLPTYLVHDLIEIEDVIAEARVVPARADVIVRVPLAIVDSRRVLDDLVQRAQLGEHLAPEQIRVAVAGGDDDTTEASCFSRWL